MDDCRNKGHQENINHPAFKPETSEKSTVEKLVVQAANGNEVAFGELYSLFVEKIYRYIFYHVKSKATAEDITGEVFLKAWRAIGSCRGKENSFSSWLYRIAHNQLIDEIRKRQRRPSLEIENIETIRDKTAGVEGYLEQQELLGVIDHLNSNQRQVIILKFIEGLDNREIAKIMGKNEGAIRALQMRALSALRKELNKE
ncbi:RNA polymerase sigma factor [Chloroflexota bacterium]